MSNTEETMTINSAIANLSAQEGIARVKARRILVEIGEPAIAPLVETLASDNQWVRWEAARALGQIDSPKAVPALVKAMDDKMFDVRWLVAQGMITRGILSETPLEDLKPLFLAIMENSDSLWLVEGAHHVVHDISHVRKDIEGKLKPLLEALEDVEPSVEAPLIARTLLETLEK